MVFICFCRNSIGFGVQSASVHVDGNWKGLEVSLEDFWFLRGNFQ